MTNEAVSKIDWKEVSITAVVTLVTATIGCTVAVVVAQTLIIPAINKAKEKRAAAKEKDAKK
jgi:hypothetical protein